MIPPQSAKRRIIELDPVLHEPVVRDMRENERHLYYFGEAVGLLVFQPWYHSISARGHACNAETYDFPVRLKFVFDPFDPAGFHGSSPEWKGFNLPIWIRAAKELQEEGVRAIVCGCGLTGMIQKELSAAVDIPVYTSTMLFVPEGHATVAKGKRVGILTVSRDQLVGHDKALFQSCDIADDVPIAIAGMNESRVADIWLTMTTASYDEAEVESAVVDTACELVNEYPDIGALVLECTDMPQYTQAIRARTGLPVLDAVDMVNWVHVSVTDPAGNHSNIWQHTRK